MPLITNATPSWSDPVTITKDEFWQARSGSFLLSTEADPTEGDGVFVSVPFGIELKAGVAVRYRRGLADQSCVISRTATST
jgi:hypothetical protein